MKYIKKPIPVEAHQWFVFGDHPLDVDSDNWLVNIFNTPQINDDSKCKHCPC